ncbi:MAG: YbaB/EbfC family nucleoid-associated protein [Armatimonadota bacterium]
MAKGFGGAGGFPSMNKLLKQVEKTMERVAQIEEELKDMTIEASSGGGMVKVTANGAGEVLSIKIAPEAVDPDDVEMLEDLVLAAVREALEKAHAIREDKMASVAGGLPGMPGIF